jgi:hypothetical protein
MAMNDRDLFAKADHQVSTLKERIARQHEAIKHAKLRGHSTAAAEAAQHPSRVREAPPAGVRAAGSEGAISVATGLDGAVRLSDARRCKRCHLATALALWDDALVSTHLACDSRNNIVEHPWEEVLIYRCPYDFRDEFANRHFSKSCL